MRRRPASPDSAGVIHGCFKPTNNGSVSPLGVVDTTLPGGTCPKGQTALSWNQTGPQGPTGPAGPAGPQGPAGPGATTYIEDAGPFVVPPNGGSDAAQGCMGTDRAISGGPDSNGGANTPMYMEGSFPKADGRWEVEMFNPDPVNSYSFVLHVVCLHTGS